MKEKNKKSERNEGGNWQKNEDRKAWIWNEKKRKGNV